MKSSERRCKLSEYFLVFLKNIPIRIKIMRKIFTRAHKFIYFAKMRAIDFFFTKEILYKYNFFEINEIFLMRNIYIFNVKYLYF